MLKQDQNERLTQVGPGTPAGNLIRSYWQPIAATIDVDAEGSLPVRIMGEDLALFRTTKGELGLVQQRCPHRSASLAYGIPDEEGIHCPYHGWYFNTAGKCIATPYDDVNGGAPFPGELHITSYPVQELGGLVWAYMGKGPAPLLPRWDLLVEEDLVREIEFTTLPCNYLQCMENSLDPVHAEWLHGQLSNYVARKSGVPEMMYPRAHLKLAFDQFEFGIVKRRLVEGAALDDEDWTTGHPIIFPNILAVGKTFQIRVPQDDTHTLHFTYVTRERAPGEEPQSVVPRYDYDYLDERGHFKLDQILAQDMMAWVTQGPVANRELETLSRSDQGIVMYRRLIAENIDKIERGEEPMGRLYDEERNFPMISIARERAGVGAMAISKEGQLTTSASEVTNSVIGAGSR